MARLYESSLKQKLDKVLDEFFNSPYDKQVAMYKLALEIEYYEVLGEIVKRLKDLPEEFLQDVENFITPV